MREIKFRVREGGTWFYATLTELMQWLGVEYGLPENVMAFICAKGNEMQEFSGLIDKNGNMIYEGDILKSCYNGNHSVVFRNGAFRIEHTAECCKPWRGGLLSDVNYTDIVIGNIFENPELLK